MGMSISRRQFILGTAAGLILPSYYDKVFTFFENHGEPLIEVPKHADLDLYALDIGLNDYQFNFGMPRLEPPRMTIRQFAARYYGDEDVYRIFQGWEEDADIDWDAEMDPANVLDYWALTDSPHLKAYRLLEELDLGSDLEGGYAVGRINFIDGPIPGSDYIGAHTDDPITLSLLQKRLNELNTGIRISVLDRL
jgi:hypothetical protein